MLAGLGVYLLNFLAGKSKNHRLAQAWLSAHKELLEANFSIVGKFIVVLNLVICAQLRQFCYAVFTVVYSL